MCKHLYFNTLRYILKPSNDFNFYMKKTTVSIGLLLFAAAVSQAQKQPVDYVNPLLGTATLWDKTDIGYTPTHRTWGGEVFPGASLPNAMVQLTPVTKFHSGSGYQYEDTVIFGFAHTSKGHWNLCNIPLLPPPGAYRRLTTALPSATRTSLPTPVIT